MTSPLPDSTRIAYLGPRGTFSEQALRSERDLGACTLVEMTTIAGAMRAAMGGEVDYAFVPIENSIEGSVSSTIDELIFGEELFIQREVVIDIHIDLMVLPGVEMHEIKEVVSHPHALAQVRRFLADQLPGVIANVSNSTSDAARLVAESGRRDLAAVAPSLTAKMYSLTVLASSVEDQLANETRFVLVGSHRIQQRTGNDRTAVVCFQRSDRPGSLHDILGAFSAREVNLTRIESRPTKMALGDYCFVIEIEGHISDASVADALCEIYVDLSSIRFLGSYPVSRTTSNGPTVIAAADRPNAREWISGLLDRISH
ncbi:MAG TPA: prephenate dehydratase [Acidimicrobiales bacterium]|nr:prephenate dehydratase [Acidimicrobiales bacterium]